MADINDEKYISLADLSLYKEQYDIQVNGKLNKKQNVIPDLDTIRSGAAAGATALQPGGLATVATTGDYNDLSNKPIIPGPSDYVDMTTDQTIDGLKSFNAGFQSFKGGNITDNNDYGSTMQFLFNSESIEGIVRAGAGRNVLIQFKTEDSNYHSAIIRLQDTEILLEAYSGIVGSTIYPIDNAIYDLGGVGRAWKDIYASGAINLSKSGETTTWALAEQSGGSLQLNRGSTGVMAFASSYFSSYSHKPIADSTYDLGDSTHKWNKVYVDTISDGLGSEVTPEQLYYLGKAIQGLAQPIAVNLGDGDTLTDQPTIYMMSQRLPVVINGAMCYFLTEDTNYYVYTSHYFDSSNLDVVPYKVIVNKSTFVVTIARI